MPPEGNEAPATAPATSEDAATTLTATTPAEDAADKTGATPAATEGDAASTDDAAAAAEGGEVEYTDFQLPEGVELDTALMEKAVPIFKELGLSKEQAQKLIDFEAQRAIENSKSQADQFNKIVSDWHKQAKTDPEIGGDKFEENAATARLAVAKFGNPAFKQLMEDHGIGNHPEMIRFMLKIGSTLKEDVPGSSGQTVAGKQDRVSILYPTKEG